MMYVLDSVTSPRPPRQKSNTYFTPSITCERVIIVDIFNTSSNEDVDRAIRAVKNGSKDDATWAIVAAAARKSGQRGKAAQDAMNGK